MILQVYIHIPFCKQKCEYCDFSSAMGTGEEMAAYGALLEREIALAAKRYPEARVSTVFVGGGTPSILPTQVLEGILRALVSSFALLPGVEFTAEANPGALAAPWLEVARRYGLNRLSLGMQAAQEGLLKSLGRIHRFPDVQAAVALAHGQGVANVNLDMMFGLPGQGWPEYKETLEAAKSLGPTHLSAYSLIVEEGTPLWRGVEEGRVHLPGEDQVAEMYTKGAEWLAGNGYRQYEISNFAKESYACKHNLGYWQGAWYLGLGLGAHSMLPPADGMNCAYVRKENTADKDTYGALLTEGKLPLRAETPVDRKEAMFETMMLGLRTTGGVGEADFLRRHGQKMGTVYGPRLEALVEEELAVWREEREARRFFALTARGLLLQNSVLLRLMD